uniref:(northern house mosquito) hypothetical protein n=1 Tax=Culex pipiens TaxID=7175 RepID=A0A8D8E4A3_CULPI
MVGFVGARAGLFREPVCFLAGVVGPSFLLGVEATVLLEETESLRLLALLVTESASDCLVLEEPLMEPAAGGFFRGRPRPLVILSFSNEEKPASSLLLDASRSRSLSVFRFRFTFWPDRDRVVLPALTSPAPPLGSTLLSSMSEMPDSG